MASIRKRGEYQYQCRILRKGYPAQTQTFETKADAEKWARDIESQMDKGRFVSRLEADSTTLYDALDRYLREITPLKKGWKAEKNRIKAWQQHKLAKRVLGSLRGADFAEYRDDCRAANLADNTIRLSLIIISHLFNIASKEWGIEGLSNPIQSIRMPKGSMPRDRRITSEVLPGDAEESQKSELEMILEATKSKELKPIVVIAVETAMRRSEILSLEWVNIDFNNRTAHLPDTKTGGSRDVPLSSLAIEMIKSVPKRMIQEENKKPYPDPYVFSLHPDSISHAFSRARNKARKKYLELCAKHNVEPNPSFLVNIRLHDQRHEGTSRLFETGRFDTMEVAAVTGHRSLQMLKRYTHLRASDLAKKLD